MDGEPIQRMWHSASVFQVATRAPVLPEARRTRRPFRLQLNDRGFLRRNGSGGLDVFIEQTSRLFQIRRNVLIGTLDAATTIRCDHMVPDPDHLEVRIVDLGTVHAPAVQDVCVSIWCFQSQARTGKAAR